MTMIAVKPCSVPFPESAIVCGLVAAESEMVRVPALVPATVGVKTTLTTHEAPAATEDPQLFDWAKSPAVWMAVTASGPGSALVRVTVLDGLGTPTAWLPKLRLVEDNVTGAMPLPVKPTVVGLFAALWLTLKSPEDAPMAVGENLTEIAQAAFAARVTGQLLVWLNGPEAAMVVMESGAFCPLVNVTVKAALWVPAA